MRLTSLFIVATLGLLQGYYADGQKYYMNFAFNNNNPEGETGETEPETDTEQGSAEGSGEPEGDGDSNGDSNGENASKGGNSGGQSGAASNKSDKGSEAAEAGSDSANNERPIGTNNNGVDDDDSDSKDAGRRPTHDSEDSEKAKADKDHSHHSSYEISIDDSFGGRYVRSIYESSESHGHAGSVAGSGSRNMGARDSSAGSGHGADSGTAGNGVEGRNSPTQAISSNGVNSANDYEELNDDSPGYT